MLDDLVEYLSRKHPSGPSTPEMLELFSFDIGKDALETPVKLMRKYGDIYKLPQNEVYIISNPEFVKYIYKRNIKNYPRDTSTWEAMKVFFGEASLTSNDEQWLRQRQMIQPGFQANKIKSYIPQMLEVMLQEIPKFKAKSKINANINLIFEMGKINTKIVHYCLFGYQLSDKEADLITESVNSANIDFSAYVNLPEFLIGKNKQANLKKKMLYIQDHVEKLYQYALSVPDTLLYHIRTTASSKQAATDEIKTLIITGEETAATGMSFLLYLLDKHPHFLAQVEQEVDKISIDKVNLSSLMQLEFTTAAIYETLRLYPPIWATQRKTINEDYCCGYYIPANKIVNIHIYAMHRNPKYWLEPERFFPARFIVPELVKNSKKAFFPFLIGAQTCPAKNFALNEMRLMTVVLLQNFKFIFDKKFKPTFKPSIALQTKHGMLARISTRNS